MVYLVCFSASTIKTTGTIGLFIKKPNTYIAWNSIDSYKRVYLEIFKFIPQDNTLDMVKSLLLIILSKNPEHLHCMPSSTTTQILQSPLE